MGGILIRAIYWFSDLIVILLLVRAIVSWFVRDINSPLGGVYRILCRLTEPIVAPCRDFMSRFNTGMIDWSVLIAMLLVQIAARLLAMIIGFIF